MNLITAHISRARAFAERGDVAAARREYKALLSGTPKNAALLTEIGVFEASTGDAAAAKRHLERALKLRPGDPDIHYNLGELARQASALILAERHYRKVVEADPNHADALFGLGECLRLLGRKAEALDALVRAHELSPRDPEILNCLGISLEENDHIADAEQAFRRSLAIAPGYDDARLNLAALLADQEEHDEADQLFAAAKKPALPALMLGRWANVLLALRRTEDAQKIADEALAKDPRNVTALNVKAIALQRNGDFARAETAARAILEIDPHFADSYQRLATMRRLDRDSEEPLRRILANTSLEPEQRATAGFALYSLLERQGDHPAAFEALARANAIRAEQRPYQTEFHEQMVARTITCFNETFFDMRTDEGMQQPGPIFILGMPRSGTTLVEQILAGYDEVHAGGERNDITRLIRSTGGYPERMGELSSDWAQETAVRIFEEMRADAPSKPFATNKAPGNYMFIGLLAWLFPQGRIIHCQRDPLDNGLSCFEQNFELDINFATDLRAFAHAYRQQERLMDHWKRVSPVPIHTVRYEELVRDPETHARALVDYVGLEWDPACLNTEQRDRSIETASVWQARQPIYTGSVGKWTRYERELAPLIAALEEQQE